MAIGINKLAIVNSGTEICRGIMMIEMNEVLFYQQTQNKVTKSTRSVFT